MTGRTTPATCPACGNDRLHLLRARPWPGTDLWRCSACGTEHLDPQPSDERLAEIYGTGYYEPWSHESEDVVRHMKQATMAPVLAACRLDPGQALLDLGCATGDLAALAVEQGLVTYGLDLNRSAVAAARARVPAARFEAGTLADEPFPGVAFDAVVMVDVLEHVRDPQAELRLVARRLAPGGRLVVSTPRAGSLAHRVAGAAWPQYREEHLTYFSLAGLAALLQHVGFTVDGAWPTTKSVTPAYLHGQALAYPVPVVTPVLQRARRVPLPWHRPVRLRFGEMTVVARLRPAGG